jgi:predicted  nucleic acid-binding Zn-ribbon protein
MAATMTPVELMVKEIEHMEGRKTSLQAAIKAQEAKIADLRSQAELAGYQAKLDCAQCEADLAKTQAELEAQVSPLKSVVDNLKNTVASETKKVQTVREEFSRAKVQKEQELRTLDTAIQTKQERLAYLSTEIHAMKEKVSAI